MSPLHMDLTGKRALVTGASGELGRVMALTLARCGADLAIHYFRNEFQAKRVAEQVRALGRNAIVVQADATQESSVQAMHRCIEENLGPIQILVLNAVTQYTWKTLLEQDAQDYIDQFESTVLQTVHLCKAFVPSMVDQNFGRVIGINTECTMQCLPTQSAYVAGKRGMDGVFRVLAREVGSHQITVNQVAPGWTVSEKDRIAGTVEQTRYEQGVPLHRRGTDQDVANAVAFLASDLASFITGAYIPVNGGNVMPTV